MALLPLLAFRNQLPQIVVDELEQLVASINVVLTEAGDDTSALEALIEALQEQVDDILATREHNLLSDRHPDTIPDDPTPGALVVGTPQGIDTDMSLYWLYGLPIESLPVEIDAGDGNYWMNGLPMSGFLGGTLSDVKWQRLPKGQAGQVLTATSSGAEWRDAGSLTSALKAAAYITANQAVAFETQTILSFAAVQDDNGPFWSSGDPTKLTVPSGGGGTYLVLGQLTWEDATGAFAARLLVNGSQRTQTVRTNAITPALDAGHQVFDRLDLNDGDYVQLAAYWTFSDTTARNVLSGSTSSFLKLIKVG